MRLGAEIARQFPHAKIKVSSLNGRLMLSGSAPDGITVDKAMTFAKQFGPDVVNSIQVCEPQQVLLAVRFVEVSRTASRELGIHWNVITQNINASVGTTALLSGNVPFGSIVGRLLGSGVNADGLLQALEERGVIRRLAEPNLTALSGDTASFLAGGEFPIPVSSNLGSVSVEFKKYGVGLVDV